MPEKQRLPHVLVVGTAKAEPYGYPSNPRDRTTLPSRDRVAHSRKLLADLALLRSEERDRRAEIAAIGEAKPGTHVEVESERGFDLELKSLESTKHGIELVTARPAPGDELVQRATVFAPMGTLAKLDDKIEKYGSENTRFGKPKYQRLIAKIAVIRLASLRSFWTDDEQLYPERDQSIWWEVWQRSPDERAFKQIQEIMPSLGIRVGDRHLTFPTCRVFLAWGSRHRFERLIELVDSISELRRAKELASTFLEMRRHDADAWVADLLGRARPPAPDAPAICLLDTGVNGGHPLLAPAVALSDCHVLDPSWPPQDQVGHGTSMAGLALYGELTKALSGSHQIEIPARLESVKILRSSWSPSPDPTLYGKITQEAVYRVEVQQPTRPRTCLMPVATTDGRERGRPSSWSATVDQLAYGGDAEPRRLWVLAAGNGMDREAWSTYPDHLETEEIHDPGQAWNALTIGAFTELWQIDGEDFEGWRPLAKPGELSPSTSTSSTWRKQWPLKPDVVFEGGNAACAPDGTIDCPSSLSLLTTHHRIQERLFSDFGDTSAASAFAGRMAAILQSRYPNLWPETIRALIVHSARWTPAMIDRYGPLKKKDNCERILRRCGFGVPSLERALWSTENELTLLIQESLRPYARGKSSTATFNELQIHRLPWPKQQLEALGEALVELRVTLSYFIEPNPSERGYKHRHSYASHGFRFEARGATENLEQFRKRLSKAAREIKEKSPGTSDTSGWFLGPTLRHKGSLHSDIWRGRAVDLANRQHVAVFPVSGWWKERQALGRWQQKARYSLLISIHAPEVAVDLYTPVLAQIGIPISI